MAETYFKPPWWLSNRHVQSAYGSLIGLEPRVRVRWQQLDLPDGDFVDLCWAGSHGAPLVVVLHGLEGSVNSHYIQATLQAILSCQWQAVVLNFRSCSGRLNRLARSYNGGDYTDLAFLLDTLDQTHADVPKAAVGFSLGGNVLMRYLGNHPEASLVAAVGVSVPYDYDASADYLPSFYQHSLLRSMKRKALQKIQQGLLMPATESQVRAVKRLRQFDNLLTAPLYDFDSALHYYHSVSCRNDLIYIKTPTMILHALDDPFIPPETVPVAARLSENIQMEITESGGHLGFIQGGLPWRPKYWFDQRMLKFLRAKLP